MVVGTSVMAAACARWHLALTRRQRRHGCPVEAHRDPPFASRERLAIILGRDRRCMLKRIRSSPPIGGLLLFRDKAGRAL
jgi:hypothetical protein